MSDDLKYIVTHDQLMDLILEHDPKKRMAILMVISKQRYHEKTFLECAAGGIGQILSTIDRVTEPEPVRKGPVKRS